MIVLESRFPLFSRRLWQLLTLFAAVPPALAVCYFTMTAGDAGPLHRLGAAVLLLLLIGMFFLGCLFLYQTVRRVGRHQRIVATERRLCVQLEGEPGLSIRRWDCVAVKDKGYTFVLASGQEFEIEAEGAPRESLDAFVEELYALWWPGLTLPAVQEWFETTRPAWRPIARTVGAGFAVALVSFLVAALFQAPVLLFGMALGGLLLLYAWFHQWEQYRAAEANHQFDLPVTQLPEAPAAWSEMATDTGAADFGL